MQQPHQDVELVERARQGDVDAYADLVRRHQDQALATAFVILGDRHEAEDATQEAFTNAFFALDRFRPGASFRAWLLRIVINEAHDMRSARQRRSDVAASAAGRPDFTESAENAALNQRRRELLLAALFDLPEADRVILTCRYFLDLPEAETADVLGVARGTVKSRLARAIARLGPIVHDLGPLVVVPPSIQMGHTVAVASAPAAKGIVAPVLTKLRSNIQHVAAVTGAASLAVAVGAFVMLSERGARDIPNAQAQPSPSVIVYGGDLSDADRQQVAATLGLPPAATQTVSHQELVNALSAEDISVAPTDAALSSVELTCDPAGSGLRVSTRDIAGLAPSEYALALVTAGLYDASAVVVAPPDKGVSGETAVVGALKALPTCLGGMAPDSHRTQLSYQQLKVTEDIAGSSGSDLSSSSSLLLQLVNDTLSSQPVDDAAITTEAASHGITLNDATRTEISQLLAELRQLDWSSYSHGIVVEDNGPNAVRLTPAR